MSGSTIRLRLVTLILLASSLSKAGKSLPGFHHEARVGEGEVTMFQAVIIRLLCEMNVSASLQTAVVEWWSLPPLCHIPHNR